MKDDSRKNFSAKFKKYITGGIQIEYQNANIGENEFISILVEDENSGKYTHYGRVAVLDESSKANGIVDIQLSSVGNITNKKIYIFNEQLNGELSADLSSELILLRVGLTADTHNILGSQNDLVYMGIYAQDSDGNNGYTDQGIGWKVLKNNKGNLFLLSDKNLDMVIYHRANNYWGVNWSNSYARTWLNEVFYNVAFGETERKMIAATQLENWVNDKIFFLSNEEASNSEYFPNGNSSRVAYNTEYATKQGVFTAQNGTGWWWLRSNGGQTGWASRVFDGGNINDYGYNMDCTDNGARPAMNLNQENIVFVSSATGEKNGEIGEIKQVTAYNNSGWKFTLKDDKHNNFSASYKSQTQNSIVVSYENAINDTNEYISLVLKDNVTNCFTNYGRIKSLKGLTENNGTAVIDITNLSLEGKTLYVFNEQYNGDALTDFSSNLIEIKVPQIIKSVDITDIDSPVALKAFDKSAKCSTLGVGAVSEVYYDTEKTNAEHETAYTATVVLTASADYEFPSDITVKATVNGQTASAITEQDGTLKVSYKFTATDAKQKIEKPTADNTVFTYNGTTQTYGISSNEFYNVIGNVQTNADNYKVTVSLKDKESTCWTDGSENDLNFEFYIGKADPTPVLPENLKGNAGKALSTVTLPEGFTWDNGDTVIVYSDNYYGMTYTPADTNNYNILKKDIKVNGLDVTFPTGEITLKDNKWNTILNNITFNLFFKGTQSISITAYDTESGIKEIAYYLSAEELSIEKIKALANSKWTVYSGEFNVEPDKKLVVYAKITDNAGNITYINSNGIVLDNIPPVIAGVEDSKDIYGDATFTVDEIHLDSVLIDGEPVEIVNGKYSVPADNKQHTIVVSDKAGNLTTYKLTVYKNYNVSFVVDGKEIFMDEVGYGKDATMLKVPEKEGYIAKWDADGKKITSDTVITAVYEKIPTSPKTGENTNIRLLVTLLMLSGIYLLYISFAKKT